MATKQELENNADGILDAAAQENDQVKQFCVIWTGMVKPALELVKVFTGANADEQIDKLIYAADGVCKGSNVDVQNYCNTWRAFHLKGLLKGIQVFTGAKVDKALNKFIELSDNLCA